MDSEIAQLRGRSSIADAPMPQYEGVKGGRYFCVQNLQHFAEFLKSALQQHTLCLDTETSGLNWVHSETCGIVIGWGIHNNYYLPIAHKTGEKQLRFEDIAFALQKLFGNQNVTYIFANAKFDLHGLRKLGLEVTGVCHDIVILGTLLDENADHGVKEMAVRYIAEDADKYDKRISVWRTEEAKRRRAEFSEKAKAHCADMIEDELWVARVAKHLDVAIVDVKEDRKLLKKGALALAKGRLRDQLCGKNKKEDITYDYIPIVEMTPYACADVHYTLLLYKKFIIAVAKHDALRRLYVNEMSLMRDLLDTEHGGVKIDVEYLKGLAPEFETEVKKAEEEIYAAIGYRFNIGSDDQLIQALDTAGCKLTKLTKGSKKKIKEDPEHGKVQFAVDKEVMEGLAAKYPFADQILRYRSLTKLKGTYIDNIQELVDKDHFLHCDYNQNVSTGRMSSKEPNLQNIPARNKSIRRAFIVPDDEWIFVFIDYSQVELRLTADRSQDPTLVSCYPFEGKGQDVHTLTLSDVVLRQPLDVILKMKSDKTGHLEKPQRGESCECPYCQYEFYRNIAKRVNFGIIYGAQAPTIQRQVSTPTRFVPVDQCEEYIAAYFRKYPGVKEWIRMTESFMKRHGYVQNSFGRYRRLPIDRTMQRWQVERACRQGVNFLIQGEAADLFKTAAVRVNQIFRRENARSRLVNFVHDELQFYWHKSELHLLKEVKKTMEDFNYKVPIVAELSYSQTDWGAKKELKAA